MLSRECAGYQNHEMIALRACIFLNLMNDRSTLMFIKVINTSVCVEESLQKHNLLPRRSYCSFFRKYNQSRQGLLNCGLLWQPECERLWTVSD